VITKKQKRAKESKVTAMLNGPMLRWEPTKRIQTCKLIIIPPTDDFFPTTVQKDCLPSRSAWYLRFENGRNSNLHAPIGLCRNPWYR
jgi:hypothetical protein